jgi:hypothetical protein
VLLRWLAEASIIFCILAYAGFRAVSERPLSLALLALPSILVLAASILAWPRLLAIVGFRDTWRNLCTAAPIAGLTALLVTAGAVVAVTGAWRSDSGDHGGATLFIAFFAALIPSMLAVPAAWLVPRLLDPALGPARSQRDGRPHR